MTQNQEPQEKQIADKRNPEQTPLPPDIDVLRTACPGLQDAWNIFQGNPKMSAELKELVQQYLKTHPDAIDPVTHKIHAEDMKKLVEQLHKRDRTFELVAINNRMVGLHDRLVARQQLEKLPVGKERTEAEAKLKESHAYESLWLFAPRLIRRCLQTMDRYVVLRNRYNYPGLVRNAKLETSVSTQITQLSDLMRAESKWGEETRVWI